MLKIIEFEHKLFSNSAFSFVFGVRKKKQNAIFNVFQLAKSVYDFGSSVCPRSYTHKYTSVSMLLIILLRCTILCSLLNK